MHNVKISENTQKMSSLWCNPPIVIHLLGVCLWHFEQLDEAVDQRHADGSQQHLEAGLHQLGQALHQAALTAVHLVVRRHHVRDEGVVGWACLLVRETQFWKIALRISKHQMTLCMTLWVWCERGVSNILAKCGCIIWKIQDLEIRLNVTQKKKGIKLHWVAFHEICIWLFTFLVLLCFKNEKL